MKHELLYQTQAQFTAAEGNSGNVTSITPGVAYIVETGTVPHYNKTYDDLIIVYSVEDITNPTKLYNASGFKTNLKQVFIDKTEIPVSSLTTTYQFSKTGSHTVRYRFSKINFNQTNGQELFKGCINIKIVIFPELIENFTLVGGFSGCTNLETVVYPKNATKINGYYMFSSCPSMKKAVFRDFGFLNCSWPYAYSAAPLSTSANGGGYYINHNLITEVVFPENITSIGESLFRNNIYIEKVTLPDGLTKIGNYAFTKCKRLMDITIPESVTQTISGTTFHNSKISNFTSLSTVTFKGISNSNTFGDGTGTFEIYGDYDRSSGSNSLRYKHIKIHGNYKGGNYFLQTSSSLNTIRIFGSVLENSSGDSGLHYTYGSTGWGPSNLKFIEVLGNSSGQLLGTYGANACSSGTIIHLGYDHKIDGTVDSVISSSNNTRNRVSKIYVGDGSSEEHDQAVLNEYLEDSNWATVSSKLDLWYNYHGEYRQE